MRFGARKHTGDASLTVISREMDDLDDDDEAENM